jgi:hypothetical protein
MEPEKYSKLFEQIIGRKLTPSEFLEARATGFDPKGFHRCNRSGEQEI